FVSSKGLPDLINALRDLAQDGLRPQLSIVGDGPEKPLIRAKVEQLGLCAQVTFTGPKYGADLARFVARHRIMAVPSGSAGPFGIAAEAFGIVAVEGTACGCVVVGSEGGGLREAIGPSGVTVPNGDSAAMARALKLLLEDDSLVAHYQSCASTHL